MEQGCTYSPEQWALIKSILEERLMELEHQVLPPKGKREIADIKRILNTKPRKVPFEIKLVDFTNDKHEPAYDVEVYYNHIFISQMSKVFSIGKSNTSSEKMSNKNRTIKEALQYAAHQFLGLMK